ncbi:hypothetical protein [Actinomadura napierensis]|uniref:DUF3040 domain-containing protein n=1 Tax=Actinomadura napierensis TaxID=267854 RepID=A0ABN2Y1A0_9ACTN
MSDHQRARRLDQRTAERLLGGAPASPAHGTAGDGPAEGHEALRALRSAAAGPPRPGELAGEDASAAAYRAARTRHAPHRSRWAALPRYATVKVAVVAVTLAVFGGGVAVAAGTGHLPGGSTDPAPSPRHVPGTPWHRGDRPSPSPSVVPHASPAQRPQPSTSPKGKAQHGKTAAPGQTKSRTPKAPKSTPNHGQGNGNGQGNGSDNGQGNDPVHRPSTTGHPTPQAPAPHPAK